MKHERGGEEVLLGPRMDFEREWSRGESCARKATRRPYARLRDRVDSSIQRCERRWCSTESRRDQLVRSRQPRQVQGRARSGGKAGILARCCSPRTRATSCCSPTPRATRAIAPKAQRAFLSIRQRFPGRPGAALSAFYLARLAEDQDQNLDEAARWLRTFLGESPSGDLAASARAKLLGLLIRKGDRAGARTAAADYLEHHPSGPHAAGACGARPAFEPMRRSSPGSRRCSAALLVSVGAC